MKADGERKKKLRTYVFAELLLLLLEVQALVLGTVLLDCKSKLARDSLSIEYSVICSSAISLLDRQHRSQQDVNFFAKTRVVTRFRRVICDVRKRVHSQ